MAAMNEVYRFLHNAYLEQIRRDIKLRIRSASQAGNSSGEEVKALNTKVEEISGIIRPVALNFPQEADNARGGAYITFMKSTENMEELKNARKDYDDFLKQTLAKSMNWYNNGDWRRMRGVDGVRIYRTHQRRH